MCNNNVAYVACCVFYVLRSLAYNLSISLFLSISLLFSLPLFLSVLSTLSCFLFHLQLSLHQLYLNPFEIHLAAIKQHITLSRSLPFELLSSFLSLLLSSSRTHIVSLQIPIKSLISHLNAIFRNFFSLFIFFFWDAASWVTNSWGISHGSPR